MKYSRAQMKRMFFSAIHKRTLLVLVVAMIMLVGTVLSVSAATTTDTNAGKINVISDGVVSQEYSEIETYRVKGNYKAPGTPSGYSDYVFAGWFTNEECTTSTTNTSGKAYAKFVVKDVLGVKAQFIAGTTYNSKTSKMRFVTTVDSLDYKEVGFKCVLNGETQTVKSNKVYKKLYASFLRDGSTELSTLLPTSFSETTSKYFMACIIKGVSNADFGDAIQVTPYWKTLDGTIVYGDTIVKTVNNGYMEMATGVTVQDDPAIDYSTYEDNVINKNLIVQGGCIGEDGGNTYYYQALVASDNSVSYILKIDMETGQVVEVSDNLSLGHTNDITYNKDLNVLVVCQNQPNAEKISFVNPSTLEIVAPSSTDATFGAGVTVKDTYITTSHQEKLLIWDIDKVNDLFSIEYNAYQQKYVIGISGGQTFRILNADFSDPNASKAAFSPAANTIGFTTQGVAADDSYIYFLLYHDGEVDNTEYTGHVIAVYDWNGNEVTVLKIPTTSIAQSIEPENIAIYDNAMYISCHNKKIYKVAEMDVNISEHEAIINGDYYTTLEDAVKAVKDGETIEIISEKVSVSENLNIDKQNVTITNKPGLNVTVKKGADFSGILISNNASGVKIQSAATGSLTFSGNGYTGSSLIHNYENATLNLSNVSFENLNANNSGAALYVEAGNVTVDNCDFANNTARQQGGAILINSGAIATVTDSTFTGNATTNGSGGAIRDNGNLTLTKCTFTDNEAGSVGGAVICDAGTMNIEDCIFTSNSAPNNGGAVQVSNQSTAVITVTEGGEGAFTDNSAGGSGGAIHTNNSSLSIDGYTFDSNKATGTGGAVNIGDGEAKTDDIVFRNSIFVSNKSDSNGGAICSALRNVDIAACTFGDTVVDETSGEVSLGNSANRGGAIYAGEGATVKLNDSEEHTTTPCFEGNTAVERGGAIAIGSGSLEVNGYTFESNVSSAEGGAIHLATSEIPLVISESSFNNNTADYGGAIFSNSQDTETGLQIEATFTGNEANSGGAIISYQTAPLDVKGSTFTNNKATNGNGGAIYLNSTAQLTTVQGSTFTGNEASKEGGAIYSNEANTAPLTVEDSTFESNEASNNGGAIATPGKADVTMTITLKDSKFLGNTTGSQGGAIYNTFGTLNITSCRFGGSEEQQGNSANRGGAIFSGGSSAVVKLDTATEYQEAIFENNKANKTNGNNNNRGGAIAITNGSLEINGYTFESNTSLSEGGAIHLATAAIPLVISESSFDSNTATATGGAIFSNSTNTAKGLDIRTTTFSGNEATNENGGAIYLAANNKAPLMVEDSQFSTNSALSGGAIYTMSPAKITLTANSSDYAFDGNKAMDTTDGNGGAISLNCDDASLDVNGYAFKNNTAVNRGGAVHLGAFNVTATIDGTIFNSNETTTGWAGAIYNNSTNTTDGVVISNTCFTENNAAYAGGAINNPVASPLTITNSSFTKNHSDTSAGAIKIDAGTLTATNCDFTGNTAGGNGGAIEAVGTSQVILKVTDSNMHQFSNNKAGADKAGGAIRLNANTASMEIDGYTFSNNSAYQGGAIVIGRDSTSDTRDVLIKNVTFIGNDASEKGGAIDNTAAYVEVQNTDFTENVAQGNGGAIYSGGTGTIILNSAGSFSENVAKGLANDKYGGGAICIGSGYLQIDGYDFISNTSENTQGGAIKLNNVNIESTIKNCDFDNNTTTGISGDKNGGGAIMAVMKSLKVEGSTFTNNQTGGYGGAIHADTGVLTVTSCTFGGENAGNRAYRGGAILGTVNATIKLQKSQEYDTQSLFANNQAVAQGTNTDARGGAISMQNSGNLSVNGYTFTGNTSANMGGAINLNNATIDAEFINSEFSSNTALTGGAIYSNVKTDSDTVLIQECTFNENYASSTDTTLGGGAIKAFANMKIEGSIFTDNYTEAYGGDIDKRGGTLDVISCQFKGENKAKHALRGGSIYAASTPTVNLSTSNVYTNITPSFTGKKATERGGAIAVGSGTWTISGYAFNSNESSNEGGAIHIPTGAYPFTITESNFTGNKATNYGGAIFSNSTDTTTGLDISATDFTGNESGYGGAICLNNTAPVEVFDCTFTGNKAKSSATNVGQGGAIWLQKVKIPAKIEDSTFKNNSSGQQGGAIYDDSTDTTKGLHIVGSTFEGNSSGAAGGAINTNSTSFVQIETTEFNANHSSSTSGAIKVGAGNMTVTDCNFTGNYASGSGGVMEATGSAGTIIFQVTAGKEGQYGFYNNYSTGNYGGVFKTNAITKLTVTGYTFSGNYSKDNVGKVIYTGTSTTAGKVVFKSCTPLTNSDIKSDVTGAVVQQ